MEKKNDASEKGSFSRRQMLERQIKFQLSELGASNAHHEFEHICRHITRARICSNILPSTGPVSGGGDGGRDFQSYRSHLQKEVGKSTFLSLVNERLLVFACSIGASNVPKKIKSDVETICTKGKVDEVHFFSTQNIQAAKRFELQQWAKNTHGVDLEIHDLQGITEHLSSLDTFWIASEYLGIPNDLSPEPTGPDWYEKLKKEYADKSLVINFAEFEEIKSALRHATWHKKEDISFWINMFKHYPAPEAKTKLSRMVTYEICVASLRGLENLSDVIERLKIYFEQVSSIEVAELEDAQILCSFMIGAQGHDVYAFPNSLLQGWRSSIRIRIEQLQSENTSESAQANLLHILGLHSAIRDDLMPDVTLTESLKCWERLELMIQKLPLYPVERFSVYLETIQELFGANDRLEKLSIRINEICATRVADSSIAVKDWNRAVSYLKKDLFLEAVNSLHRAVDGFLNHESIEDAVKSLISLSKVYQELGLQYAAKYYAMCAFSISYTAREKIFPKYLAETASILANLEYGFGCWHSFITKAKLFFIVYSQFRSDPHNSLLNDKESSSVIMHLGLLDHVTKRMVLEHKQISNAVDESGLPSDDLTSMRALIDQVWGTKSSEELKNGIVTQLMSVPYCDGGATRAIKWSQFGLEVEIYFKNNYLTAAAAEQFAFVMQVLMVAIGSKQLCLIPGLLQINFSVTDKPELSTAQSDNSKCCYKVEFPKDFTSEDFLTHVITSVVTVVNAKSVIPTEKFLDLYGTQMKEGLAGKLFVGSSYFQQFCNSIDSSEYETPARQSIFPLFLQSEMKKTVHLLMEYNSEPITSKEDDERRIKLRYENCQKILKHTLPKINRIESVQEVIKKLKEKGWLDWQILQGIANLVVNYRVQHEVQCDFGPTYAEEMKKYFNREETEDDIQCPVEMFTERQIEMMITTTAMSTMKALELEFKSITPQISDTIKFLKAKCGYNTDIPHNNIWAA